MTTTHAAAATPAPAFVIDAGGDTSIGLTDIPLAAARAEADGADGVVVSETKHDPFVSLTLAAQNTERVQLFSGIAVAFARSPMTLAMQANDIQELSGGRLVLGLGSQVQQHIERRFSMPWSRPAARMRDFVLATKAIWHAWETSERLNYRGEFYTHTLMSPFFDPGPNPHGNAPIWVAAVGERMTETAGEVADGVVAHTFTTRRYLDEVTLPALRRGAATAGRADMPGVSLPAFVAMGRDEAEIRAAAFAVGKQIAFYGSTPAYLPVLELHGWAGVHEALNAASRRGEWQEMASIVTEEIVREFAVIGTPEQVAAQLRARYDGVVSRLSFSTPYPVAPELWPRLYAALRS